MSDTLPHYILSVGARAEGEMTDQVRGYIEQASLRGRLVAGRFGEFAMTLVAQVRRAAPHAGRHLASFAARAVATAKLGYRLLGPHLVSLGAKGRTWFSALSTRQQMTVAGLGAGVLAMTFIVSMTGPSTPPASAISAGAQTTAAEQATTPRWRLASFPSLNTWTQTRAGDAEQSAAAIGRAEAEIAARNGGVFRTAMTLNPSLMTLTQSAMDDRPMEAVTFEKDGETLTLGLSRIRRVDAMVLIGACGEEPQVRIAGLDFVRMSDADGPGFSAMLPRRNGDLVLIRSTLPQAEVQKLVTPARLQELGLKLSGFSL